MNFPLLQMEMKLLNAAEEKVSGLQKAAEQLGILFCNIFTDICVKCYAVSSIDRMIKLLRITRKCV